MGRPPPNDGGGGSCQIKGGGRAVMSTASRQALVSLLMRLQREGKKNDKPDVRPMFFSSEREQQREERLFVKRLVRAHEVDRCTRRLNGIRTDDHVGAASQGRATPPPVGATSASGPNPEMGRPPVPAPATTATSKDDSKVRVEIVEAIFMDAPGKGKQGSHTKAEKRGTGGTKDGRAKFKEGTKKLMVTSRSTLLPALYKQAQAKLRMKQKPVRAFVAVAGHAKTLVDLEHDLSGVSDGTVIYVTTSVSGDDDRDAVQPIEKTEEEPDSMTNNLADPLDDVKRAYAMQDKQRREKAARHHRFSQKGTIVVDHEKAALMEKVREKLPAVAYREQIVHSIQTNPVTVIVGSTGCGKSTQIPQFIYEQQKRIDTLSNMMDSTNTTTATHPLATSPDRMRHRPYIVVTQPRRVAAISLAHRVAEELGSPPPGAPGSLVGYIVRLDRRMADETCKIVYCTVGVLLRLLVCPQPTNASDAVGSPMHPPPLSIDSISHLIVDEVHERDVNTDFCLTLLKGLFPSKPHLRLILMSATASSQTFVRYFSSVTKPAPPAVLDIPGRSFPVQVHWLSDCECFAGSRMWEKSQEMHVEADCADKHLTRRNESDNADAPTSSRRATNKIDNHFIRALIRRIVEQQQAGGQVYRRSEKSVGRNTNTTGFRETGAILVFLPGRAEIDALSRCLYEDRALLGDREICKILKLHSTIPRSDQELVFQPALDGTVKIILSTNLAESSVTISDVNHCIDTVLVKESRFNSYTRIKELVTVYSSRASSIQRAGRAGRTSEGTCWRLVSEDFWECQLLAQTPPEMIRTPLDELILQISLLYERRRDEIRSHAATSETRDFPPGIRPIQFLSKTPTPPPEASLVEACRHLLEVDALRVVEGDVAATDVARTEASWFYRLTPMGYHLSRLPMDAKVGKVLIVGCLLGCLDGALTIAASLMCKKPCFLFGRGGSTPHQQQSLNAAAEARATLVEGGFGGPGWKGGTVKGDSIAVIAAYRSWKEQESEQRCWDFCKSHALDHLAFKEMDQLRRQFLESMIDAGFVPRTSTKDTTVDMEECNQASDDALLTSCCLVAGLYPNICTLVRPRKGGPKGGRLLTKDGVVCRAQSNSFQRKRLEQAAESGKDAYAVFHAKQQIIGTTTDANARRPPEVFLTEINFVSRFALLLFGGQLDIVKNAIVVDGWLKFKVSGDDTSGDKSDGMENAVLIQCLRDALDDVIREHVLETSSNAKERATMMERHKVIIEVVRRLLSEEGQR